MTCSHLFAAAFFYYLSLYLGVLLVRIETRRNAYVQCE